MTILQSRFHLDRTSLFISSDLGPTCSLFLSFVSDAVLREDLSVTDLLVVVVVVVPMPTAFVHPKDLKNQRPPQSSTKSWMRLWEMPMLFRRTTPLLRLREMLIWPEHSFSPPSPPLDSSFSKFQCLLFNADYMPAVNNLFCDIYIQLPCLLI